MTLMQPASLIALITGFWSRTCLEETAQITTSTCFIASTRLDSSSIEPYNSNKQQFNTWGPRQKCERDWKGETLRRVAPASERVWRTWRLWGWEKAESLTRAKVGCEDWRLALASWCPRFPVAPIISTLLFPIFHSSCRPLHRKQEAET